jgi:hypothetical protein
VNDGHVEPGMRCAAADEGGVQRLGEWPAVWFGRHFRQPDTQKAVNIRNYSKVHDAGDSAVAHWHMQWLGLTFDKERFFLAAAAVHAISLL